MKAIATNELASCTQAFVQEKVLFIAGRRIRLKVIGPPSPLLIELDHRKGAGYFLPDIEVAYAESATLPF